MMLEWLPFREFFSHFDLAGLNHRPGASDSWRNNRSSGGFLVLEIVINDRKTLLRKVWRP
jgi:hypothetical protein